MRKWTAELYKLIFTHIVLIGIPTIFFYCLRRGGWSLTGIHMSIATFYVISSIVLIVEATVSSFRRYATREAVPKSSWEKGFDRLKQKLGVGGARLPEPSVPVPKCSFLVAAYLPNEQDIILDTLKHLLEQVEIPAGGLEVILAYNTPIDLPVEDDLERLAERQPNLKLLRVEGSRSKAENLNAALDEVTGEIVCVLDADHHPAADCFRRAWRWLDRGYDVVQGRNIIRNHRQNLLTENIAIEFEMIYGVCHPAKSFLTDTSIFGGSNGYWRTSVLKRIRFNPTMLTEDIDASMRTLLNGYRILHDRSIVTTELAPADLRSFWFQRKRWAQGWLEVSLKYQRRIWKSSQFTFLQKAYWTYLLYFAELYTLVAIQIIPISLSELLFHGFIPQSHNHYLWFSSVIAIFSGLYQTVIAAKIASRRYPLYYFLQHAALIYLFVALKNSIAIVGFYDHIKGNTSWLITPRSRQTGRSKLRDREAALTTGGRH
ncbi:glycosyltransferase family 2 protein [Microcoleus sp. FACHB-1515]|uniref:glycosyltransferase n=1 Tax=Cyanophyceae TaxID=3028117 RepID=UPI0016840499|nr:glycosyltransferase [Microcoleus sp. FACHB-1515]MBD2090928.1 glycosyltransferase family 2 protein [Microcoleus sp. FACHB-1515]